jgi:hypothetical protein
MPPERTIRLRRAIRGTLSQHDNSTLLSQRSHGDTHLRGGSMASKKKATTTTADVPVVETPSEIWKAEPDEHDYPAARSFLSLLTTADYAKRLSLQMKKAPIELHPAKDVLRGADLPLLAKSDPSVARDLAKVKAGDRLSPVLVVRGDGAKGIRAIIADGYHRVCASYHLSENEQIPCRLIDYPSTSGKK